MLIVVALLGLASGWLIHHAATYLPRFATEPDDRQTAFQWRGLALWRWLRGERNDGLWLHALLEVISTAAATTLWLSYGPSEMTVLIAACLTFLLLVTTIDMQYRLVLNVMVYPAALLTLLTYVTLRPDDMLYNLVGASFAFIIFYGTALLRPGDLGGGDVKLATLFGLVFGFPGVIWVLIVGGGLGAITAVGMLLRHRGQSGLTMPYAPFLCAGAAFVLFAQPLLLFN